MPDGLTGCGIMSCVSGERMRRLVVGAVVVGAAIGLAGLPPAAAAPGRARSCPHPTVPVPPNEPVYSSGPTELVSGLYVQGGAIPPPPCKPEPRGPYAGTIRVINPHTGAVVARQTVANGHLAHIMLAPGRYDVSGHFSGGITTRPLPFRLRTGRKVRLDNFEDVP